MTTPNLSLEEISQSQANKYLTHNNALRDLDVLVQASAVSIGIYTPPGSPSDGDTYIIPQGSPSATGVWAGFEGYVAFYKASAWRFLLPSEGWIFWIEDENTPYRYDGSTWAEEAAGGGGGSVAVQDEGSEVVAVATALNFTGAGVTASDAGGGVATINIPGGGGAITATPAEASATAFETGSPAAMQTVSAGGTATIGPYTGPTLASGETALIAAHVLVRTTSADATSGWVRLYEDYAGSPQILIASVRIDALSAESKQGIPVLSGFTSTSGASLTIEVTNDSGSAGTLEYGVATFNEQVIAYAGGSSETTGTFTPTYVPQTNSFTTITYNVQLGYYRRVGRKVEFNVTLQTASLTVGSASGALYLDGLPFTHEATYEAACVCGYSAGWGSLFPMAGKIAASSTQMNFTTQNTTGTGHAIITVSNMDATAGNKNLMNVTGFYFTDDP